MSGPEPAALLDEQLNPTTHARVADPDTSHSAAAALGSAAAMRRRLLEAYGAVDFGLTAEEAARRAGIEGWAASKRVSDLKADGLVVDSGDRRPGSSSGRAQAVLTITDLGREALR